MLKGKHIVVVMGITLLFLCGCDESTQPRTLPIAVEGDAAARAAVVDLFKANPQVVIPQTGAKYSIEIVKPDTAKHYSILRIAPDPNINYSVLIIDPATQQPTTRMDPNIAQAIIDAIEKDHKITEKHPRK